MARPLLARIAPGRIALALFICACVGVVLFLATFQYGLVSGEEFAPDTFERRSYWYYELPLVQLKLTPVFRSVQQNQLEAALVNDKYITQQPPPKRWDLVAAQRGGGLWRKGDAQILCHYLDAWDPNPKKNMTSFWETWTSDHPTLAKVLWPEVVTLARRDLYYLIPSLFERALAHEKPQSLQNDLNLILARNYHVLAETEVELEHFKTAIQFYSNALNREPGRTSSLNGRATCYEELGKTKEAARDRQAASQQLGSQAEQDEERLRRSDDEP